MCIVSTGTKKPSQMAYPHVQTRQTHSDLAGCGSEIRMVSLLIPPPSQEQPAPSPFSSPPSPPKHLEWPRDPLSHGRKSPIWSGDPTASEIAPPARSREWNSGRRPGSLREVGRSLDRGLVRGWGTPPPRPPTGCSELPGRRCWRGQGLTELRGWAGPGGGWGVAGRQQRGAHQH